MTSRAQLCRTLIFSRELLIVLRRSIATAVSPVQRTNESHSVRARCTISSVRTVLVPSVVAVIPPRRRQPRRRRPRTTPGPPHPVPTATRRSPLAQASPEARQAVDRQAATAVIVVAEVVPSPTPAAPLLPASPADGGFGRSPAVDCCVDLVQKQTRRVYVSKW